jgi:glycine betaine/choline ABC-type transport system substrate-binding protein
LQPAENVTPLLRQEVVDRFGDEVVQAIDGVSATLTTDGLREMNEQLEQGTPPAEVARDWLARTGT